MQNAEEVRDFCLKSLYSRLENGGAQKKNSGEKNSKQPTI